MDLNVLTIPATRGRMGETDFFTANIPMGVVVKLFLYDPERMGTFPVEQRTQRALKKNRVPEIADYVLSNDDYLFSSITVSVNAEDLEFQSSELNKDIGVLRLPMEAEWIVNDGQHRVAGIEEALKSEPSLKTDALSVVILPDGGLERSQQIFSDLNRTVQKTSHSLDTLFDHRVPVNRITNACADEVELFKGRTDKERVALSIRSAAFASLSGLQRANSQLLGDLPQSISDTDYDEAKSFAVDFWNHVAKLVEPWPDIVAGVLRPAEARVDYLSSYALVLWALGWVGGTLGEVGGDWKRQLEPLRGIDWRKINPEWQGICMQGTDIVTRQPTRRATAEQILWKLGIGAQPQAVV